jgi:hypothetical protein
MKGWFRMHPYKNLLIGCCFGAQFVAYAVILRQVYYRSHQEDDLAKLRMKKLILIASSGLLISCVGVATLLWTC